jgi:GTP-binding protein Era
MFEERPEGGGTGEGADREQTPAGDLGPREHRSGYVAIAGRPNAGKSTLLNALVRARLAAVSPKPQTSRRRTLGILTGEGYQMILLDTPGVLEPRNPMEKGMERAIRRALGDADVVLYLVDAVSPGRVPVVEEVAQTKPTVVALNKVDLLKNREQLLPIIAELKDAAPFREFLPISALYATNLHLLVEALVKLLPPGPAFYPPDQITEQPERFFVAELIREQIFLLYRQEIPYVTEVLIEEFQERPGAKDYIRATIIVEGESQKAILIGRGGKDIKKLGSTARQAIEEFLGRPVYLELRVKAVPKWRKNPAVLRRLGLA